MKIFVQILGTDTYDSDPSVLIFYENKRYLFNVGESTQRFCGEHKVKMSKIKDVFLTRLIPYAVGGIPGFLLTQYDTGITNISIHGPPNLVRYIQSLRFLVKRSLNLMVNEIPENSNKYIFEDENLKIKSILITINKEENISEVIHEEEIRHTFTINGISQSETLNLEMNEDCCELTDEEPPSKKKKLNIQKSKLPLPKMVDSTLCYICHTADLPGKFDPKKAIELGLKPGPDFGKLQKGLNITLEDGRVIKPEMVMGQPIKGGIVIILSCPNQSFLKPLVEHQNWKEYFSTNKENNVVCMIHMTPNDILLSKEYKNFISKFSKKCQHIILNKNSCPQRIVNLDFSTIQSKLNLIDENIFRIPFYSYNVKNVFHEYKGYKMIGGDNLLIFNVAPIKILGIDKKGIIPNLDIKKAQNEVKEEILEMIEFYKKSKEEKSENVHETNLEKLSRNDAEIVLLGTGSAIPSKYRNVSGIYLHLFDKGGIAMDWGEGSTGQLYRAFGIEEANKILINLKCIWISHIHTDHHAGIAKLLFMRQELIEKENIKDLPNLVIIGTKSLQTYLKEIQFCFAKKLNYDFINHYDLIDPKNSKMKNVCDSLGLTSFYNVPVVHCRNSFGLILEHSQKWKFVYSGDTMPCNELIKAGKDATVVLHEATFEDSLKDDAIAKKHCTTKDAIETCTKMNAYRIILTHFSQRYPKIPNFSSTYNDTTCVAFDLMRINFKDLKKLPKILPILKKLFEEEEKFE